MIAVLVLLGICVAFSLGASVGRALAQADEAAKHVRCCPITRPRPEQLYDRVLDESDWQLWGMEMGAR